MDGAAILKVFDQKVKVQLANFDALKLIKQPKWYRIPFPQPHEGNNKNFVQRIIDFEDQNGVVLSGVFAKIEWKASSEWIACNEKYSLFSKQFDGGVRPIFQIEVTPSWKQSHRDENGSITGPHIHVGVDRVVRGTRTKFDCGAEWRQSWFKRFARHINAKPKHKNVLSGQMLDLFDEGFL